MKFILLVALLAVCTRATSQSKVYTAYLRLGVAHIEDSKSVLPNIVSGINHFHTAYYGIGGEFEYKVKKVVFTGNISILSHGAVNNDNHYAEPFMGAIIGGAGLVVVETKNVFVYPIVGAGLSGLFINTYTKTNDAKTGLNTSYLLTPTLNLGVNGNVIIYRFRNEPTTGILPVGLRAGYRFTTESDKWKKIPETNFTKQLFANSGWYISVALGFGYYSSGKIK